MQEWSVIEIWVVGDKRWRDWRGECQVESEYMGE